MKKKSSWDELFIPADQQHLEAHVLEIKINYAIYAENKKFLK